jgi:hypothetical protein
MLITSDPDLVLQCCKQAYDQLIDHISLRNVLTYPQFKAGLSAFDVNTDAFLAPVNKLMSKVLKMVITHTGSIWRSDCKHEIIACAQFFGFLMKLPISNMSLEQKALEDYLELEQNYPDQLLSPYKDKVRKKIAQNMREFYYDGTSPRNGTGSTAELVKDALSKYRSFSLNTRLTSLYAQSGINIFDFLPLGANITSGDFTSRLQFVPKNVTKLRSISMEPCLVQYVQQGVMVTLYDYFKTSPNYRHSLKLEDQSQNQHLAYDGSITNYYCTIDMSSASDLIGMELVEYLFGDSPNLLPWLMIPRSAKTLLPNGVELPLRKFAPMGSANCFPVESIIFHACTSVAIDEMAAGGLSIPANRKHFSVYGDDIIVPHYAYDKLTEILESFGFKINRDKSYKDSPFKESCGVNYHCGYDITPIKWKIAFTKDGKDLPTLLNALASVCNAAFLRKYKVLRCHCIKVLKFNKLKPLFTNEFGLEPMIYSPTPTNFHLKSSWRKDYQKTVMYYSTIKTNYTSETVLSMYCTLPKVKRRKVKLNIRFAQQSFNILENDLEAISYYEKLRTKVKQSADNVIMTNNMSYNTETGEISIDVARFTDQQMLQKSSVSRWTGQVDA